MKQIAIALLMFASAVGACAATKQNILLIIADDYGVDSSSLYNTNTPGSITTLPPTPNIASLVTNGVVFRNAYANPVCSPTRSCILTGQHGFRTGVGDIVDFGPSLTTSSFTLPKAFTNAALGYSFSQFGKWHLAAGPNSPRTVGGWTNFAGSIQGAVANYTNWTKVINGANTLNYTNYATTDLVNDATSWITNRGTNAWFVWAAFNAPHTPFHNPPTNLCPRDISMRRISGPFIFICSRTSMNGRVKRGPCASRKARAIFAILSILMINSSHSLAALTRITILRA